MTIDNVLSLFDSSVVRTVALGAAMLAGTGAGVFSDLDEAYRSVRRQGARFEPRPARRAALAERRKLQDQLYGLLRSTHHTLAGHAS